jgi:hypothetical protein
MPINTVVTAVGNALAAPAIQARMDLLLEENRVLREQNGALLRENAMLAAENAVLRQQEEVLRNQLGVCRDDLRHKDAELAKLSQRGGCDAELVRVDDPFRSSLAGL